MGATIKFVSQIPKEVCMSTKKQNPQTKAKVMPKAQSFDWTSALQRVEAQEKE